MQNSPDHVANSSLYPENPDKKSTGPSTPHSIRFPDSEWERIEREAKRRGTTAAALVRFASIGLADGELSAEIRENSAPFPSEILAWTKVIFNGVYLFATLKEEEMIRDGLEGELGRIGEGARTFNESVTNSDS